jgi:hypothetical protein
MQVVLDQASGVQPPKHAQCRREYGQRLAVPGGSSGNPRPGFGEALGGFEKNSQQGVTTTGHGHCGEHFRGRHAGRTQRFEPAALVPPMFFAAPPDEELGQHPPTVEFGLANQPLAGQNTQQRRMLNWRPSARATQNGSRGWRPAARSVLASLNTGTLMATAMALGSARRAYSRPSKK